MNIEQYCNILRSALAYEKSSLDSVLRWFLVGIAVLCVAFIVERKKMTKTNAAIVLSVILLLCGTFAGAVIQYNVTVSRIETDIESHEFVRYEGKFVNDDYKTKDSFYDNVYVYDGTKKKRLRYPDCRNWYGTYSDFLELPEGEHDGIVIYGKNSNILLEWDCNE